MSHRSWLLTAFQTQYRHLVAGARRRGATPDLAEDLVQDTFLRVLQADRAVVGNPRAYLAAATAHRQIDEHRRHRVTPIDPLPAPGLLDQADPAPSADRQLMGQQDLLRLRGIIEALPLRQREVFTLHRLDGLPPEAIARRLGISRNMVDRHLRHALARCVDSFYADP